MFFVLSKTAAILLLPSNLLAALVLAGFLLMATRWRRAGRRLAVGAFVLMLLIGFLPVGAWLGHVLENRFPRWDPARGAPDGVVVLGGVIDPLISRTRGQVSLSEAAERVTVIAKLARDYPKARIVFSSGDAGLLSKDGAEAHYLYPLLDTLGVPRARVQLEDRARNTAENAVFTKALVHPKPGERWLLVTSAQHMPRAMGCFRRVGFPVEAYPVDYDTPPRMKLRPLNRFSRGLDKADDAVHEWMGLAVYWLTGRTGQLLPGP
jgi:uncharacterized SAM-binding protein YcdF (DUF218 family)